MPSPPDLELRDVSKRYGELAALDGVSFTVRRGETVGYLGPNGAGKTTTLKLLAGLTRASQGSVLLQGVDPSSDRRGALASVGILVETPGTLPYITGEDLLLHVAEVKGIVASERRSAARAAATTMGVEGSVDRRLGTLSTGLLRRVQLAGTLIGDPKVLILDEPTLGLDPAARADLRATLRTLAGQGRTVLLSTHLLEDVEEVCRRVLFLRGGKLVGDEPTVAETASEGSTASRALRISWWGPTTSSEVQGLVGERARVEPLEASRATLRFQGGPAEQSELLRLLVAGGVKVVGAEPLGSDLASRYMAKVGREEAV